MTRRTRAGVIVASPPDEPCLFASLTRSPCWTIWVEATTTSANFIRLSDLLLPITAAGRTTSRRAVSHPSGMPPEWATRRTRHVGGRLTTNVTATDHRAASSGKLYGGRLGQGDPRGIGTVTAARWVGRGPAGEPDRGGRRRGQGRFAWSEVGSTAPRSARTAVLFPWSPQVNREGEQVRRVVAIAGKGMHEVRGGHGAAEHSRDAEAVCRGDDPDVVA
jgi:hypothetical protein